MKKIESAVVRLPVDVIEYVGSQVVYPSTFGDTLRKLLDLELPEIIQEETKVVKNETKKKNRKN